VFGVSVRRLTDIGRGGVYDGWFSVCIGERHFARAFFIYADSPVLLV